MHDDPARLAHQLDVLVKAPAQHGHVASDISGIGTAVQYPTYKAVREREVRPATVDNTVTIDLSRGRVFTPYPITATTTFKIINHPPLGVEATITLFIPQDETGNHAIIWPDNVIFDPAPPPISGPNKMDIITLVTWDGGTYYHGRFAGSGTSTAGATVDSYDVVVTGTHTNLNLRDYVAANTSWDGVAVVDVSIAIATTAVVGSLDTTKAALYIGQFPAGSYVTVNIYGQVLGAGGAINAGTGGDAIYANYNDQSTTIICQSTGKIQAGGGGGGKGGDGGGGVYTTLIRVDLCSDGQPVYMTDDGFCRCVYPFDDRVTVVPCGYYPIYSTIYTAGGTGGDGGRGLGYLVPNTTGTVGGAGGLNAGAGGTGGSGGTWGAYGASGQTGANGNNGTGAAGFAGGPPGNALVKSTAFVYVSVLEGGTVIGGTL